MRGAALIPGVAVPCPPRFTGITSACDGAVQRIDTGMASSFEGLTDRTIEVLEVTNGLARVVREDGVAEPSRDELLAMQHARSVPR